MSKAVVTRVSEKGERPDFKIEWEEDTWVVTGKNTALLIARCLDAGVPWKLVLSYGYDTKGLKWELDNQLKRN